MVFWLAEATKRGRIVLNALKRVVMFFLDLITKTLFNEIVLFRAAQLVQTGKHADRTD